jgi:hypothetical protein
MTLRDLWPKKPGTKASAAPIFLLVLNSRAYADDADAPRVLALRKKALA